MSKTSTLALVGAMLGSFLSVSAWAFPVSSTLDTQATSNIMRVAEGCGPGFRRDGFGHCRPAAPPRACPRGFHWSPAFDRCVR